MSNKQSLGAVLAVLLVLLGLGYAATRPAHSPTSETPAPGALSSVDNLGPYINFGGVTEWNASGQPQATSSAFCSIQNRNFSTSTILAVGLRIDSTGLGTQTFDIATSTTQFGTSTPALVYGATVPVASGGTYRWSPGGIATTSNQTTVLMPVGGLSNGSPYVLAPNEYLNFRIASGTPGTFASYLTGKCTARFQAL